jgi:hypothetical protein
MLAVSAGPMVESRETGLPPAKRGAGGSGLLGLPPYREDGVPGRGLPFMCSGSNETDEAAGRGQSPDPRDGVHGLPGEALLGDGLL